MVRLIANVLLLTVLVGSCAAPAVTPEPLSSASSIPLVQWKYLADTAAPPMAGPVEQTMMLSFDIDCDGRNDIVVGGRGKAPALVWLRFTAAGWQRWVIEPSQVSIEAGGAFADIDGDGDLDIVAGEDYSGNRVFWWENPHPNHNPDIGWTRRLIKSGGQNRHHDQVLGDFNSDGRTDLAFWNQGNRSQPSILYVATVPPDPRNAGLWAPTAIFTSTAYAEGLTAADVNGDGTTDLVGGGYWFRFANGRYVAEAIDAQNRGIRVVAGQIIPGGRLEVVTSTSHGRGTINLYRWTGAAWERQILVDRTEDAHSLALADLNLDGALDIFCGEMRLDGGNPDSRTILLYGNGAGAFHLTEGPAGVDHHESRLGDIDGDGDLDILGKPYNFETPRLHIWLNETNHPTKLSLSRWRRHVIDAARPDRAIFVLHGDINGDNLPDIVSGAWWYRNPGRADGQWVRTPIGEPLRNAAILADVDNDGDLDIFGTQGRGSERNGRFAWARNDGSALTVLTNLAASDGDFLQGAVSARFTPDGPLEIALSWHEAGHGIQQLRIPDDPAVTMWNLRTISSLSQDEELSVGDIDRDGDLDLLTGTRWLRNDDGGWTSLTIFDSSGAPDRNRLADINRDGRLDAVVGFEAIGAPGKLAWYEQGEDPMAPWIEHSIAVDVIGPMSLDVGDLDGDGDLDIVLGEHDPSHPERARLLIFENDDGYGVRWRRWIVFTGDEHHDGAQLVDIDNDSDLDIISIGWSHSRVLVYENLAAPIPSASLPGTPTPPGSSELPDQRRVYLLMIVGIDWSQTTRADTWLGAPKRSSVCFQMLRKRVMSVPNRWRVERLVKTRAFSPA
ncbi:MAG: VCBS repeat-containing protein [Roseiflexus sp.]|nr:VCBS repeat-containing protein [Roseiflexus sp.]MCS7289716.1 VCBS repeat-containing protein [Roseiflexus sp.]MDW8148744.1 VCBS repeat-containing protein [Roseiflexaceae bacterium]MDW8233126.1 VCBS repeat-containing protein [Roseiflexaceae bacterium]